MLVPASVPLLIVQLLIFISSTSAVSLSPKRSKTVEYQRAVLPVDSALIKEESAQVLLSSLLVGSVPVPSFVSDQNVPSSFARFEAQSITSDVSTGRVASIAAGDESKTKGTPIVMLHGFDSSAIEYRRLAPLLTQQRDVYIPDILGWGFSDHTDVKSFTPAAKMAHLKSFITEIVGEPCIIVGASLGGAIAILLATESPELVEKVVLIDAQVLIAFYVILGDFV